MKRLTFVLPAMLLLLFLLPRSTSALGCDDLKVHFYLDCEDGSCEGFQVTEEYIERACGPWLPQVMDLSSEEAEKISTYLQNVGRLEGLEQHQQIKASMFRYCGYAVLNNRDEIQQVCATYNDQNFQVERQIPLKTLDVWRKDVEDLAYAEEQAYYQRSRTNTIHNFSFIVVLPLVLIVLIGWIKRLWVPFAFLVILMLQISFFFWRVFIGLFTWWPLETLGMILLAIVLETIYFIWYQIKKNRTEKMEVNQIN